MQRHRLVTGEEANHPWRYRGETHHSSGASLQLMEPGEFHQDLKVPPSNHFKVLFIDAREFVSKAGLDDVPHFIKGVAATKDRELYLALKKFHSALANPTFLLRPEEQLVDLPEQ